MSTTPYVTPAVAATAAKHGVDLSAVAGTGVGGRIRVSDVRAAAGLPREPVPARPLRALAPARPVVAGKVESMRSVFSVSVTVQVNPWSLNPLLEDAKQSVPWAVDAAQGPAPTMFPTGDLPLFVASGADPSLLLNLPMPARLAAVNATAEQFARMLSDYADADTGYITASMELPASDAMQDYQERMRRWLGR